MTRRDFYKKLFDKGVRDIDSAKGYEQRWVDSGHSFDDIEQPSLVERGKELAGTVAGAVGGIVEKGVETAKEVFTPQEERQEQDYSIDAIQQSLAVEPTAQDATAIPTPIEAPIAAPPQREVTIGPPQVAEQEDPFTATQEAIAGTTAIPTEPEEITEKKMWAAAESESPLMAGLKEAGLALTFSESPVSPYRKLEHPAAATTGQIAGTLAPMVIGTAGAAKVLSKIPKFAQLASSGKTGKAIFDGVSRMTGVAIDNIIRYDDELFGEDDEARSTAIKNIAINVAAAGVSPTPEQFLSRGLIQPVAQGATDLSVEIIGQALAGDNAFSKENLANTVASTLMGSLFGVADIKGVDVNTKNTINEIRPIIEKAPVELEISKPLPAVVSPERVEAIGKMVRAELEKTMTPAKSNIIEPEKPEFEVIANENVPSGIEAVQNVRKPPTEADLKLTVKEGADDTKDIQRIPGEERIGKEPIETKSVEGEGEEAVGASRVFQAQEGITPDNVIPLPERKRGFFAETGAVGEKKQITLPKAEGKASKAEKIFEAQDNAVRNAFHKPLKQKVRDATDFLGEKVVDRVYYAKRLLGKTPEAHNVIGKVNASKGSSAEAKLQYDAAEKEITKNLPYEIETITNRFIEARRISEIEAVKGEGKIRHTGGMTKEDADLFIAEVESKLPQQQVAAIKVSSDRYWKEMNNQLKQLRDNGLISEASYKTLSEQGKHYSPRKFLQHIDPERSIITSQGNKISVRDSGIKSLGEGSEQAMVNNWRLLLSDVISRTQTRIFKNKASKALGDFVKNNQENVFGGKIDNDVSTPLPRGMERIFYMEKGESKAVLVPEKFAKSWNQNDVVLNRSLAQFLNIASGSALVRPLATGVLAPEFALSNIPRDMALQWLSTNEYSKIAPVALIQNFNNFRKVFKDAWTGKGRYRDYVDQGGGMEFLNEQGSFFVKDPTKTITPTTERNRQVLGSLSKLQEFSERLTRLALREQAIKNGKTPEEATKIAREYLDFAQGGSWVKALNNAIPYLNASTQGVRSVVRGAREDPATFSLKATQLIMMGSALAYTANRFRKEEWDNIGDREKVNRWNFPLGRGYKNQAGEEIHSYLSIPKDQSSRIFASIGETIAERKLGVIDGETAWKRMSMAFEDMSPIDAIGMLPPSLSAIVGYSLNKNFWKRDDIWKGREVSPYMEFYEGRTPEFYKDAAESLDKVGIKLSPERLNQSLQQTMPANPLTALMGGAYDAITGSLDKTDKMKLNKTVMESFTKMPGIRKYLRSTYPSKTDYKKMVENMRDYGVSRYDSKGNIKSDTMIKNELARLERKANDIRQKHDREASIISEMLTSGKERDAIKLWGELREKASKELGGAEIKRINSAIKSRIKKNKSKDVYKTIMEGERYSKQGRKPTKYMISTE